ncbi:MAG TPA: hypothetical protein PLC91_01130 [Candidatus Cloacimonadota bacterium]|nr:hypothetical protein [Candidatus Cloacimonadota bacterium]
MEELFRQASELKQNGDWQGALAVYEKIYADESQRNNQNLVLSMLSCLKKLEQYERAIEIGLPACELEGRWDAVASLTAWCIYFHHFKKPRQLSAEQAVEWLETIKRILPQSLGLHPLPLAVFSYFGNSPDLMPSLVVQICRLLDPDLLDTTKQPSNKPGTSYPSPWEKHASLLSKALFNAGDYPACFNLCREVLNRNLELSTNADIWFRRRMALCLGKQGDYLLALKEYEQILPRKRDWFILYEAALAAYRLGQTDRSLELALQAANAYGDADNKIHLWELLQNLMAIKKEFDRSIAMLKLCAAIRKQRNWRMDNNLIMDLKAHNIDLDSLPPYKVILRDCQAWMRPGKPIDQNNLQGRVSNLLPHGKAGFIKSENQSYYFQVSQCLFPVEDLHIGLKVAFCTRKSFDHKKQQESVIAVKIKKLG